MLSLASSNVKWNDSLAIPSILIGSETWQQINGQDQMRGGKTKIEGPRLEVGERPRAKKLPQKSFPKLI
ncbi:hypothetical protein Tco_1431694 [Tanacetum coccineum]